MKLAKEIKRIAQAEFCVTSKCNLFCKHCYQHNDKNKYELDFEKVKAAVDFAISHHCERFVFSGGEFFTYKFAYELLNYVLSRSNTKVAVATNSLLINFDKIKDFPKDRLRFKISLDGDKKEHECRRGEKTYDKTIDNITKLKKLGFFVGVTCTLIESNIHCIPEILGNELFDEVTFMPVANTGAAKVNIECLKDSDEYEKIIKLIYKKNEMKRPADFRCNIFPYGFSVKYNGDIFGCSLLRDLGLKRIGNINDDTIEAVFDKYLQSEESDEFFLYTSNSKIEECNKCNKCSRGCRARALKYFGKFEKPDPFSCKIFNDGYKDVCFGNIYWGEDQN